MPLMSSLSSKLNEFCIRLYRILKINFFFLVMNGWLGINILFIPFNITTYPFFLVSIILAYPSIKAIFTECHAEELTVKNLWKSYRTHFKSAMLTGILNTIIFGIMLFNIANIKFVSQMFSTLFPANSVALLIVFIVFLLITIFISLVQLKVDNHDTSFYKLVYSYFYVVAHPGLVLYGILFGTLIFLEIFMIPTPILLTLGVGADLVLVSTILEYKLNDKENHYGSLHFFKKNKT